MNDDEERKQDYRKQLCSLCINADTCDKNKLRIRAIQERITIVCGAYKYKNDLV